MTPEKIATIRAELIDWQEVGHARMCAWLEEALHDLEELRARHDQTLTKQSLAESMVCRLAVGIEDDTWSEGLLAEAKRLVDWPEAAGILRDITVSAYETCPNCRGSGMQDAMDGPVTCHTCHGDCVVRCRDEKGRYCADSSLLNWGAALLEGETA